MTPSAPPSSVRRIHIISGSIPIRKLSPSSVLELLHDALQVLARVGVQQLAGLGVVAVAEDAGDPLVPGQDPESVEIGDRGQLGLLGAEADVVAAAVGEQVGGRAVDELVAPLGDLGEERGDDALAHHAAGDRDLLEVDVLDPLVARSASSIFSIALRATGLVARLLEGRRGLLGPRALEHRLDRPAKLV